MPEIIPALIAKAGPKAVDPCVDKPPILLSKLLKKKRKYTKIQYVYMYLVVKQSSMCWPFYLTHTNIGFPISTQYNLRQRL